MPESTSCRVLVLGAHPDDAEVFAGGLVVRHCLAGSQVKIISVTDGRSGHFSVPPEQLVERRRQEARRAGERIGAEYVTWDFHDGALEPNLSVRSAVIKEIRSYKPDLILTHRPNDYHPDHRAVGTVVQDASYMVTVPHVCPEIESLRQDPVVAYMCDLFTRPNPMRPDIILDTSAEFDLQMQMAACHESQFFEWLPFHDGILDTVPSQPAERLDWLSTWFMKLHCQRRTHFERDLVKRGMPLQAEQLIEVYEVSEYAGQLGEAALSRLFPGYK